VSAVVDGPEPILQVRRAIGAENRAYVGPYPAARRFGVSEAFGSSSATCMSDAVPQPKKSGLLNAIAGRCDNTHHQDTPS
jgi:hypothetical protein